MTPPPTVLVVGGGLAGTEAAWQLAIRGVPVELREQKPLRRTPAQTADGLAELVCSNSFRGAALGNAVGLLKEELRRAGSLVIAAADLTKVPAGGALAVDRDRFSATVTRAERPGRRRATSGWPGSRRRRTGTRWTILVKLPTPGSKGSSANSDPVPGAKLSTWAFRVTPGRASIFTFAACPCSMRAVWVSLKFAVT